MKSLAPTIAVVLSLTASGASALPPIGDHPAIRSGLFNVAIAYEIARVCPSIKPRTVTGLLALRNLRAYALELGYSVQEVNDFLDDRVEKRRLEDLARADLASRGAIPGDAESHCRVGRAEQAADSQIGRLLR